MSTSVDERVVEMQFNNSQFESGVQKTLATLDKLKDALHLKGASEGLDNVEKASSKFSLDGMASAIESVNDKFSALGVVGFSVLNNLVSKATDAGLQMVKSLSVDQIAAGWTKFGQKTGSVATLVSQGYALEEVNDQMERLNWFTDETSYNYVDMANNIGKFTATGQDLDSSVTAMMGIANWAALSGQNATVASRAMYQLSQAMSKGALRYDDWRSIQNASMDTKEFRENALEAAIAIGHVKKNLDGSYQVGKKNYTLNEMFTSEALTRTNWFTSDTMMKTFQKYAGAVDQLYEYTEKHGGTASQAMNALSGELDEFGLKAFKAAQEARSWADTVDAVKDAVSTGWMTTFEAIFGNYDQATKLWTSLANNLYEVFMFGAEQRNELFQGWNELGGHAAMLNSLENIFSVLLNVMEAVREAFTSVFPPITSENLYNITLKIEEFTKRLKDNEELVKNTKTVFQGLFSILNIGRKIIVNLGKGVVQIIHKILTFISPLTDKIKPLILSFSELVTEFDKSDNKFEKFKNILDSVKDRFIPFTNIFDKAREIVKNFFGMFSKNKNVTKIEDQIRGLIDPDVVKDIEEASSKMSFFSKVFYKLKDVFSKLKSFLEPTAEAIKNAFSKIKEAFISDDSSALARFASVGFTGAVAGVLVKFINTLSGAVKDGQGITKMFKGVSDKINEVFGSLKDSLESLQGSLKSKTLKQIAISIGVLAGSVFLLSLVDPVRLGFALAAITGLFTDLMAFVSIFEKINASSKFKKINFVSAAMIKIAASVLILSFAMKTLSSLSLKEIGRGLLAITGLMGVTVGAALLLSRFSKKVAKGAEGMIKFSIAVAVLAAVMKSLSSLSWEEIGKGLVAVLGLVGIMTGAAWLLSNFGKKFMKGSLGMILFASAIAILAKVMNTLVDLSWEQLGKGLAAIGGIALILSGFLVLARFAKKTISVAISFIVIASAMSIFANVMSKFAEMKWEGIGKAFTVFGGIILIVSALSILLSKTQSIGGLLALSASLILLGAAMAIFQSVFSKMGNMSWEQIGKAFLVFGGSLVVLGVAALLLSNVVPAILAVAGAFALLGLGLQLVATAIVTFNLGDLIHKLARGVEGLSAKLRAGMFLTIFKNVLEVLKELVKFIPLFIASFVKGLIDGFVMIANSGAKLIPAIVVIGVMLITALEALIPRIIKFAGRIILAILEGIDQRIEQVTEIAGSIIFKFLVGLSQALPLIILGAIILMYNFINGMAMAIRIYQDLIFAAEKNLLSAIIEYALSAIQEIVELIPGVGKKWAEGLENAKERVRETLAPEEMEQISTSAAMSLAEGFRNHSDEVEEAGEEAAKSGTSGIQGILGLFTGAGEDSTDSFANGLLNKLDFANSSGLDVGESSVDGMHDADYNGAGLDAVQGFANGMKNNSWISENAARVVGRNALFAFKDEIDSNSPSKKFEKEGFNSDKGFANGLIRFSGLVENASSDVGDKAISAITSSIARIDDYVDKNIDSQPTIRPVLDLSDIQNGVNNVDGMLNRSYTLSQTGYNLAGKTASSFNRYKNQTVPEKSDKAVVAAVGNLSSDINKLGEDIKGMGLYLDGKKVGRIITPTVNRNLYVDSVRKGRNN